MSFWSGSNNQTPCSHFLQQPWQQPGQERLHQTTALSSALPVSVWLFPSILPGNKDIGHCQLPQLASTCSFHNSGSSFKDFLKWCSTVMWSEASLLFIPLDIDFHFTCLALRIMSLIFSHQCGTPGIGVGVLSCCSHQQWVGADSGLGQWAHFKAYFVPYNHFGGEGVRVIP